MFQETAITFQRKTAVFICHKQKIFLLTLRESQLSLRHFYQSKFPNLRESEISFKTQMRNEKLQITNAVCSCSNFIKRAIDLPPISKILQEMSAVCHAA